MPGYDMRECPACHKQFRANWIGRHMREQHPESEERRGVRPPPRPPVDYEFTRLPCGRQVDSRAGECCRTVCPEKSPGQIDYYYQKWKQKGTASLS